MQYIHLNDDSYILHTSQGIKNLNRKSFNFNKIKRMINKGAAEEDILPLLVTPELPDGIYQAYIVPEEHAMYYMHMTKHPQEGVVHTSYNLAGEQKHFTAHSATFVGVYASKADLVLDWPEYTI